MGSIHFLHSTKRDQEAKNESRKPDAVLNLEIWRLSDDNLRASCHLMDGSLTDEEVLFVLELMIKGVKDRLSQS